MGAGDRETLQEETAPGESDRTVPSAAGETRQGVAPASTGLEARIGTFRGMRGADPSAVYVNIYVCEGRPSIWLLTPHRFLFQKQIGLRFQIDGRPSHTYMLTYTADGSAPRIPRNVPIRASNPVEAGATPCRVSPAAEGTVRSLSPGAVSSWRVSRSPAPIGAAIF